MPRALLSVADKAGLVEFAQGLVGLGWQLISTGGTAAALVDAGLPCTKVSEVTGFPELLDGRVKTLHPAIHGPILARRDLPSHLDQIFAHGMDLIDLVAVNLYPFRETVARGAGFPEAIEQIDIGGPAMVRAAAKNHAGVVVVVDPARYPGILAALAGGGVSLQLRAELAAEAFAHTAAYDAAIAGYLGARHGQEWPREVTLSGTLAQVLKYGENPHQAAAFYRDGPPCPGTLAAARRLGGPELSYNNLNDADAALHLARELAAGGPAAVVVKHANPCGVAYGPDLATAFRRAYAADPISAFGGIVAVTRTLDEAAAAQMLEIKLDVVLAPDFEDMALERLGRRPGTRLLAVGELGAAPRRRQFRSIAGGFLLQDEDAAGPDVGGWRVVTKAQPGRAQWDDLAFAWTVAKHVKSNAIVLAKEGVTVGIGPGQPNRADSARIAASHAGAKAQGSVLASDAFIPFPDTVAIAAEAGVAAIAQPGGSVRDGEVISAADLAGLAMVFTGRRHFRH